MLTMRMNVTAVTSWCDQTARKLPIMGRAGLRRGADYGFQDSQRLVHVRTGNLKRSGYIQDVGENKVEYGYTVPYAHEEEYGNAKRPPHPYVEPGRRTLQAGLAADYVYEDLRSSI